MVNDVIDRLANGHAARRREQHVVTTLQRPGNLQVAIGVFRERGACLDDQLVERGEERLGGLVRVSGRACEVDRWSSPCWRSTLAWSR